MPRLLPRLLSEGQTLTRSEAERIGLTICGAFGLRAAWTSRSRKREYTLVRHTSWYILHKEYGARVIDLADITGYDHSTISVALRKIEKMVEADDDFRENTLPNLLALVEDPGEPSAVK